MALIFSVFSSVSFLQCLFFSVFSSVSFLQCLLCKATYVDVNSRSPKGCKCFEESLPEFKSDVNLSNKASSYSVLRRVKD
jgi:hypothetical protein